MCRSSALTRCARSVDLLGGLWVHCRALGCANVTSPGVRRADPPPTSVQTVANERAGITPNEQALKLGIDQARSRAFSRE
jgi:hypothetical protein